eukprot:CAMPEP_0119003186 /NCGR_PEP_ID=MMETSP1176-20130426/409_1 /TAXON_ID=265551 /ORGANISM="Synedropsis recta cf, Strain CCMP1620" /LENGTH=83 /DNA_ID=CAMNT_0006954759 /DNA_START=78 /DNA_END=329 /DNA_ORIENTATION=-
MTYLNITLWQMRSQPARKLLTVELFREMQESRNRSGTTDVAIAKSEHVREYFAASYQNPDVDGFKRKIGVLLGKKNQVSGGAI